MASVSGMVSILTQPEELHVAGIAPFRGDTPGNLVFCCFFREVDARAELLERLKVAAGGTPVAADARDDETVRLADQYERHYSGDRPDLSLEAAIIWRSLVLRREYHTYALKEGYPPYRFGLVVAFTPMTASDLRANLARAHEALDDERVETMDVFGWGISR